MAQSSPDRYLTFLPEPDAAEILQRSTKTETYYPDTLAADVLRSKYLAPGEEGPLQLWERVARALASVEEDQEYWFEEFFGILFDFKFVPGGRVMHGAGRDEARPRPLRRPPGRAVSLLRAAPRRHRSVRGLPAAGLTHALWTN